MHMYKCLEEMIYKLTYYLQERKAVAASLQLREWKKPTQENNANDRFGKGLHVLQYHMLNYKPFNDWVIPA